MFEVRPKPLALGNGRFAHNAPWPASFTGVALGVLDGWQIVMCGGGLEKCWYCYTTDCQVVDRAVSASPAAVSGRYYGTLLAGINGQLY